MKQYSLAVLFILCSAKSFGQGANGSITGTVADPSGAVISDATITIKNSATGAVFTAVSTATGNYAAPSLPVGVYDLSVTVAGFKTYNRVGLDLAAAQSMRIDVPLEIGAVGDAVTVTAEASLLKTETSAMATNVTVSQMNNLPILSVGGAGSNASSGFRDPFALAQMMPGTSYGSNGIMVINGTPNNNIQVRIDGQVSGNLGGLRQYTAQQQPSTDAIQEVAVQTSNYSAEFGTVGGGIFNASMKSGTNAFHGSAYDYSTNEAINASTPYIYKRSQQHRWDYGFTVGGPVFIPKVYDGKNKTFFFWSFEQFYENLSVKTQSPTVPIAAYRAGDFGPTLTYLGLNGAPRPIQVSSKNFVDPLGNTPFSGSIFDPASNRDVFCPAASSAFTPNCAAGTTVSTRLAFVNNKIPLAQLDPVALKVLADVPLPLGSNADAGLPNGNYQVPWVSHRVSNLPSLKLDHNIGSKGHLSGYWQSTGTTAQYSFPNGSHDGLPQPMGGARGTFIYAKVVRVNYDHTLTPTTVLHIGAGWNSLSFSDKAPTNTFNALSKYGLKGSIVDRQVPGFITGVVAAAGGMNNFGGPGQGDSFERRPSGSVSITRVQGNHTYKAGAEWRLEKYPSRSYTNVSGSYAFGVNATQQSALNGYVIGVGTQTGFQFASFLLGGASGITYAFPTDASYSKQQWGLFAQDTWKLTRKLTLDYGVRWDYGTYTKEQYGRFSNFNAATPNPSAAGHPGAAIYEATCKCNFAKNYPLAIGPRIGLAYQLNSKTVLRGGFGVVYTATGQTNGGTSNSATTSTPGFAQTVGLLKDGRPANVDPQWPNFSPSIGQPVGAVVGAPPFVDPGAFRPAKQYQWSVGLQREINRNLVIEASYVANRGVWWSAGGLASLNTLSQADLTRFGFTNLTSTTESALLTTVRSSLNAAQLSTLAARGIVQPYSNFPSTQNTRQSILPFPQYTAGLSPGGAPLGNTWYDSIQLTATQRFSHGLSATGNYTFAKNLDLMSSTDIFNRANGKDISNNDVPHQIRMTAEYQVPNLSKSGNKILGNPVVSYVLGNWGVGWFVQYQSAPALGRPATNGALPISNFFGRGPGSAQLNKDPTTGELMNPYSVDWTDYSGTHHTDPIDINCHCFDPTKNILLNPLAWSNVPDGQWAAQQNTIRSYRGIRAPQENLNISRNFRIKEKVVIHIRAEFQNVMNRTRLLTNAATPGNAINTSGFATKPVVVTTGQYKGLYSSGFGVLNPFTATTPGTPQARTGTLIARITF
ncbi:MAG: TonB-dependent receptor [Acidobacteriota bacterium]